jgi:hypothetical protein
MSEFIEKAKPVSKSFRLDTIDCFVSQTPLHMDRKKREDTTSLVEKLSIVVHRSKEFTSAYHGETETFFQCSKRARLHSSFD